MVYQLNNENSRGNSRRGNSYDSSEEMGHVTAFCIAYSKPEQRS
jgi:hypothetical protein